MSSPSLNALKEMPPHTSNNPYTVFCVEKSETNPEHKCTNIPNQIAEHDNFIAAEVTLKRDIFNPSGTEIRKMLDENLLKTFLVSTGFLNVCKQIEEEAGGGLHTVVSLSLSSLGLDYVLIILYSDQNNANIGAIDHVRAA